MRAGEGFKKICVIFGVFVWAVTLNAAAELTAPDMQELVEKVAATQFKFKERAKVYGYFSTQSCLYVSAEFALLEHYCFPKADYPARGMTVISPRYGMVHFYQEYEDEERYNKRDITIRVFPEVLAEKLPMDLRTYSIKEHNEIEKELNKFRQTACWATNFSYYTRKPDSNCVNGEISQFLPWSKQAMLIAADLSTWDEYWKKISVSVLNQRSN